MWVLEGGWWTGAGGHTCATDGWDEEGKISCTSASVYICAGSGLEGVQDLGLRVCRIWA